MATDHHQLPRRQAHSSRRVTRLWQVSSHSLPGPTAGEEVNSAADEETEVLSRPPMATMEPRKLEAHDNSSGASLTVVQSEPRWDGDVP